jgi:hypothetical protein
MRRARVVAVRGAPPRVGPVPAWIAWGGVLLLDLTMILGVLAALTWAGDRLEDVLWPGGIEWVDL